MLTRLDRLCESLGDTLHEVVFALLPLRDVRFKALQTYLAKTMHGLCDQMPRMARRQRLVLRMSRKSCEEFGDYYGDECETARRHVFVRASPHWRDAVLED